MTTTSWPARELGLFLRSRRERTTPAQIGLEPGGRRRVAGLRREEVAALAGLSADYYQRLEQGRNARPSDAILDSIAEALDLDDAERSHLMRLAQAARHPPATPRRRHTHVPRNARALLEATRLPAFIISPHLDVLAWNSLAAELLGDPADVPPAQRNVLLTLFADDAQLRFADCRAMAIEYVGMLRSAIADDPEHPRAIAVVGALSVRSAEFRTLWARHDVRDRVEGGKTIRHPRIGAIDVEWDAYGVPGGANLIVMTPRPGHEDRLRLLSVLPAAEPTTAAAPLSVDHGQRGQAR
ncbi:helix-turn-helix transcriptional regulator [Xylanimonas ulmi]|uniref:Transcriptional regulator with XRE-family HTH domain n=1 Tax=Xylanimonas ulmi TaxID=228973 RepID=A0A4Q7M276_9MICO|nr:helix-turn-helix transcriptional regulator [Xylanibacterium ulmi]RZS60538.1 transcriptional regulator with XRE-family HTH domain [Xylanibacterium ulmi]